METKPSKPTNDGNENPHFTRSRFHVSNPEARAMSNQPATPTAGETLLVDTREPWPHPWQRHLPEIQFQRRGLETGDICLAGNPLVVVERKTVSDFLGSITAGRSRFNDELKRARFLDSLHIIVEGNLTDCLRLRGGMSEASFFGTVAAYERRKFSIIFAGSERCAALLAWRLLSQPIAEANRLVKDSTKPAP